MGGKGLETKESVILKALDLFSVKGYYHTSIQDILEATDLTKGGLYGHFESKTEIWEQAYEKAVSIWKEIVFKDTRDIGDPLKRIQKALDNDLRNYLGGDVFKGGCFFLNMLVELSGQSETMSRRVLNGMMGFSEVIRGWLEEAKEKGMIRKDIDTRETARFIVVSISGCSALYASSRDPGIWKTTLTQLHQFMEGLKP
ncbi:MAG: TetR/AcrR family transcriptional regulator [Desulfobacteraceae bacterium]|nr:TetR/AcrR family transcriptional regulator [Desulfobacteraceae bacterium]